jgi:hypothetical protein
VSQFAEIEPRLDYARADLRTTAKLHLRDTWPWAGELLVAFQRLKTLSAASG